MNNPQNRMKNYLKAFGIQGGTIHQISKDTGVDVHTLLYGKPEISVGLTCAYSYGWFALRSNTVNYNLKEIFPRYKGNADFWLGVADAVID